MIDFSYRYSLEKSIKKSSPPTTFPLRKQVNLNSPCSLAFCLLLRAAWIIAASGIAPLSRLKLNSSGWANLWPCDGATISQSSSSSDDMSSRPAHSAARPFRIKLSGLEFLRRIWWKTRWEEKAKVTVRINKKWQGSHESGDLEGFFVVN